MVEASYSCILLPSGRGLREALGGTVGLCLPGGLSAPCESCQAPSVAWDFEQLLHLASCPSE